MMTGVVFGALLAASGFSIFWHAREFIRHAVNKRVKLAQVVLFTGPLGWVAFVGQKWGLLPAHVTTVLIWFGVVGAGLHLLFILTYESQVRR